tara:strand:- start:10541 stop:12112 length:1572 start_codon:yes stop_codon:yes gene_type:complete
MQNSVRKIFPLATAFLLALCSASTAGDNAGVVVSIGGDTEISDVGAGATVEVALSGAGMVGVKQFDVTLTVSPADAFDLSSTTFAQNSAFTISPGVEFPADGQVKSGAASFGAAVDGDAGLGTFTLTTSADFTSDTEATITVTRVSLGPSSTDRDVFDADALGLSIAVNPPPPPAPPVVEPILEAVTVTDASLDYSAVGEGDVLDGSAGELAISVELSDSEGNLGSEVQAFLLILNNGSESVYLLDEYFDGGSYEVVAGEEVSFPYVIEEDGLVSLVFDAEADRSGGTTSLSVTVSASVDNSEGVTRDLSVDFSATWDVPVAAELASFTSQVTVDEGVLLQWGVASQSNNLGWEVFRSTDGRVFTKVSDMILGDGNSDEFKSYDFIDSNLPQVDVLYYYLNQIDLDGTTSRSQTVEVLLSPTAVAELALPTVNALQQNFPNPFNPETMISFDLSGDQVVSLTIYDMAGQVVRKLVDAQPMTVGSYKQMWDGRNNSGAKVGSGIYFYQLRAGDFIAKRKMTLLQ